MPEPQDMAEEEQGLSSQPNFATDEETARALSAEGDVMTTEDIEKIRELGVSPTHSIRDIPRSAAEAFQSPIDTSKRLTVTEQIKSENPDVDFSRELEGADRAQAAKLESDPENYTRWLDDRFGPRNWDKRNGMYFITDPRTGVEFPADSLDLNRQDLSDFFADPVRLGTEILAGVTAGGIAFRAAKSFPMIWAAVFDSLASQGSNAAFDAAYTIGDPSVKKRAAEIFQNRGPEAAADFLFNTAAMSGTAIAKKMASPNKLEFSDETVGTVVEARDRIRQASERMVGRENAADPNLTVAQATGSAAVGRVEAIFRKIPGADGVFNRATTRQLRELDKVQKQLRESEFGRLSDIETTLNRQYEDLKERELRAEFAFTKAVDDTIDVVGDALGGNAKWNVADLGTFYRKSVMQEKNKFDITDLNNWNSVDEIVGDAIIPSTKIANGVKEILINDFLTRTKRKGGDVTIEPVLDSLPADSSRRIKVMLDDTIDNWTFRKARFQKSIIRDMMKNKESGVSKNLGGKLIKYIDSIQDEVVEDAGEDVVALYKQAKEFHKGVDKFNIDGYAEALVPKWAGKGYVEDSSLGKMLASPNTPMEVRARVIEAMDPETRAHAGRAVLNDIVERSQDIGSMSLDLKQFEKNLTSVPRALLVDTIGEDNYKNLLSILQATRAKNGKLAIDQALAINPQGLIRPDGDIARSLREVIKLQKQRLREFENGVIDPFLRDPTTGLSKKDIKDLPNFYFSLSDDKRRVLNKSLEGVQVQGTSAKASLRRSVIESIFKESSAHGNNPALVQKLLDEGVEVLDGERLRDLVRGYDEGGALTDLIGADNVQLIKSIATLRTTSDDIAASTAGGLIAGGLITQGLAALDFVAYATLASWALTSDRVAKLASAVQASPGKSLGALVKNPVGQAGVQASLALSEVAQEVNDVFGNDPGIQDFIYDWLSENVSDTLDLRPIDTRMISDEETAEALGMPVEQIRAIKQGQQ